ncbi:MAG TPA: cysteine--tRNA ligase [Tepidisphaeraceae bacterium]|jgi:cysteinyl-tRNA synthetase|nr:cysteine--tRNA ligase [Tepidisphaeraceae bacterium]
MSLRVYNTLTREKEPFTTVTPHEVKMYLCGPTVYKSPHIGHMVGPVIFDAIKRYLQTKSYKVTWVVNITDVDDKLIDKAAELKTTVPALAEKHTKEYFEALQWLGIDTIDHFPKASEYMSEIVRLCQTLIDRNHAYATGGNVWFSVTSDPDYGKLSNRKVEQQESTGRDLAGTGKRNPADFALWKSAKPGEISWPSPWGPGRPGWHIECSAMSIKLLGESFDIHGGGMDLMFPHHENELAQSESATGKTFARYWLHNGLTRIKTKLSSGEIASEKMSGSIGNVVNVLDMKRAGENPDLFRYLLLSTHYRRPIEFNDEVIANTKKAYAVFTRLFDRITRLSTPTLSASEAPDSPLSSSTASYKQKFLDTMDDDFNTAGAIGVLHELAGEINSFIERTNLEKTKDPASLASASTATQVLHSLAHTIGLFRTPAPTTQPASAGLVDDLMKLLIQIRADARAAKNFPTADAVRKGLTSLGITLEDRPDGTLWHKN